MGAHREPQQITIEIPKQPPFWAHQILEFGGAPIRTNVDIQIELGLSGENTLGFHDFSKKRRIQDLTAEPVWQLRTLWASIHLAEKKGFNNLLQTQSGS